MTSAGIWSELGGDWHLHISTISTFFSQCFGSSCSSYDCCFQCLKIFAATLISFSTCIDFSHPLRFKCKKFNISLIGSFSFIAFKINVLWKCLTNENPQNWIHNEHPTIKREHSRFEILLNLTGYWSGSSSNQSWGRKRWWVDIPARDLTPPPFTTVTII